MALAAPLVVGAYAAVGDLSAPDAGRLVEAVLALPGVGGLEVPYLGGVHANGSAWLLERLGADQQLVVTMVTDAVRQAATQPGYGLASDGDGRGAALSTTHAARHAVQSLADTAGRAVVRAVELQSAPSAVAGASAGRLRDSLAELAAADWAGAELLIEHCDALVPGQDAAKGYLPLETELRISSEFGMGVAINWGRSAIEGRSDQTPLDHVATARQAGLLRALAVSGCSDRSTAWGPAWADAHVPPAAGDDDPSLLTPDALRAFLAGDDDLSFRTVKVSCAPGTGYEERLATVARAVAQTLAA